MNGEMNMARDLGLILPEIAAVITAVLALVSGMIRRGTWAMPVAVLGLSVATGLTVPLVGESTSVFMETYRVDTLSVWSKLLFFPGTALVCVFANPEVRGTDREATVHSLLIFATIGALALSGGNDMMFLVLGVLLSTLAGIALVAYPRTNSATEGALKYFVFGSVSGAVMIFGLTFWFGAVGSTLFTELGQLQGMQLAGIAGLLTVLVGLGYKASLTPFHFWAPDAYDGAPIAVAAYTSVVPKIAAIFALARIARELPGDAFNWQLAVAVMAVLSMTYGNLAALQQTNLVRLLAYSSIAQAGYFLLGVVAIEESDLAVRSLIVFAAAYTVMNLGAFAVVARVGRDLESFAGLGRVRPFMGIAMVVFLVSLVGIPPLAGFFGKLLLFGAAIDAGFTWLAVIGILNSVLSLAVYLRIVGPMYLQPSPEPVITKDGDSASVSLVWTMTAALTLVIGIGVEFLTRTY